MTPETIVIIPAYNEERAISGVVASIRSLHPGMDVVVINDGSSDATAEAARSAGARVLSHPVNMGYGVSLQTGYKYAARNGYHYLVQLDGDGQHDPSGIRDLLAAVTSGEADVALGSRFIGAGEYSLTAPRIIGIRMFRCMLRLLSGKRIMDVTTGFQAMNGRVLDLFTSDAFPCDYPDADVILLLVRLKYTVKEVPVRMHARNSGISMHGKPLAALYYVFKVILSMILTMLRKYKIP